MFYEVYSRLCSEQGIRPHSQAAADRLGVTRGAITYWKKNGKVPDVEIVKRAAEMLHVDVSVLLESAQPDTQVQGRHTLTDADLKAAFWGGDQELSPEDLDAMWNDVRSFASFVAEQKKRERKQQRE